MAVIDSSVIVAALAPDECLARAVDILEPFAAGGAYAPTFWPLEVANAFTFKQRRGLMDRQTTQDVWRLAMDLPVTLVETSVDHITEGVLPLVFAYGLTVYDALYLHLSIRQRMPLATLDRRLATAALAAGVITL